MCIRDRYGVENVDEYGNYLAFTVTDEGDYKFSISLNLSLIHI